MNKEEVVKIMIDGFIEDMRLLYSNAGISDEESEQHIEQGRMSFELMSSNMYDRLLEKSIINL
jgi:hypothetical protein